MWRHASHPNSCKSSIWHCKRVYNHNVHTAFHRYFDYKKWSDYVYGAKIGRNKRSRRLFQWKLPRLSRQRVELWRLQNKRRSKKIIFKWWLFNIRRCLQLLHLAQQHQWLPIRCWMEAIWYYWVHIMYWFMCFKLLEEN